MKSAVLTSLLIVSPVWADTQMVTLEIPGMNCAACPITIKKALTRINGVEKVAVSYTSRSALVIYDDALIDVGAILEATGKVGYPSTILSKK